MAEDSKKKKRTYSHDVLILNSLNVILWLSHMSIYATTGNNMHALNEADIRLLDENDDFCHFSV